MPNNKKKWKQIWLRIIQFFQRFSWLSKEGLEEMEYYTINKIKKKFEIYKSKDDWNITDDEYDTICDSFIPVPKNIFDRVYKEVEFVVLSSKKNCKEYPACYLNLNSKDLYEKKGVIFVSPIIFKEKYNHISRGMAILHEIYHHLKRHDPRNLEERKKADDEADAWSKKMINYWFDNQKKTEAIGSLADPRD